MREPTPLFTLLGIACYPYGAALTGMLLFALTQVFWESMRRDGFLRFGFVRVNQMW